MSTFSNVRSGLRAARNLAAFAVVLLAAGCGDKTSGTLHPVTGKVTLDNAPMTAGAVRFVPDKAKGNTAGQEPVGTIGADGSYSLTTGGRPGAPAGWYKVTVASGDVIDSTKPFAKKTTLAPRYANPDLADLPVEVGAAPAAGAYDLKVSAK